MSSEDTDAMSDEHNEKSALVPRLRFPEFREAGEWAVKTLSELAENLDNRRIPITEIDRVKGVIPYYGASGIVDYIHDFIFDEDLLCISEDGANLVARTTPIAFSISGKTWVNNHAHVLKFESRFVQKVVEDYLNSISLEDYLTGMAQPKLNRAMLDTIVVPVPQDEDEQQAVADCLSSLDDLITAQSQKIDALKTHKKGLMQQLFPAEGETLPRLRFPEFREAGEWERKAVGEVFQVTRGEVLAMPKVKDTPSADFPYPVYSSQTKSNGLAGYYSEYLYKDAITWTTDGANAGEVNFRPGKFYCTNVCGVLLNSEGWANAFVAALLNSVTRGHVSYVGNPKLMNGVMSEIVIPFPSLSEQHSIASFLSAIDDLIAAQTQKIELLKRHKKGLMQQLFPVLDDDCMDAGGRATQDAQAEAPA